MGVVHNDTQRAYPHSVVKAYMPKICVLFFTALLFFLKKRYFSTGLCFDFMEDIVITEQSL